MLDPPNRLRMVGLITSLTIATITASAAPEPTADELLDRTASAGRELESLTANLTRMQSYPQLGMEDPAETGRIFVDRGGAEGTTRARIEIERPAERIVTMVDGQFMYYQPAIRQVLTGTSDGRGESTGLVSLLLGDLPSDAYDASIVASAELDPDGTRRVRLTATDEAAEYVRIELTIDLETGLPIQQELEELNGTVTRITLDDIELGSAIADDRFELALPDDVEVVRG